MNQYITSLHCERVKYIQATIDLQNELNILSTGMDTYGESFSRVQYHRLRNQSLNLILSLLFFSLSISTSALFIPPLAVSWILHVRYYWFIFVNTFISFSFLRFPYILSATKTEIGDSVGDLSVFI